MAGSARIRGTGALSSGRRPAAEGVSAREEDRGEFRQLPRLPPGVDHRMAGGPRPGMAGAALARAGPGPRTGAYAVAGAAFAPAALARRSGSLATPGADLV